MIDGATYLCGYAVELALKARICTTLKWQAFPVTRREFEPFASFKTHNLDTLLALSGQENKIRSNYIRQWSIVSAWDPETRYRAIGSVTQTDERAMIASAQDLLRVL